MNRSAIALLSGGLDSTLAAKVILEQGIDVVALNFTSAFCTCTSKSSTCRSEAVRVSEEFGMPVKVIHKGEEYIDIVRNPKYGYGKGINPCIDCRIFMFVLAKRYMEEIGASFIFTGEVLGQRPMSQRREVFSLIERESGLEGRIVRPLCAKHLEPTIPEKAGIIDRKRLLDFIGRSRKPQIALAGSYDIQDYPCPSGGCLLTDKIFSRKVKDLFKHKAETTPQDLRMLKSGRHFRTHDGVKIVIGRDRLDNRRIAGLRQKGEVLVEPVGFHGPVALVSGGSGNGATDLAGRMILRYAGEKASGKGTLRLLDDDGERHFAVDSPIEEGLLEGMRI